jgi:hypothetical protein
MVKRRRPAPATGVDPKILDEIREERARLLEYELEALVVDGVAYRDELARRDGAHGARLAKRRRYLMDAIRRVRELMPDQPITKEDVRHHLDLAPRLAAIRANLEATRRRPRGKKAPTPSEPDDHSPKE